MHEVPFVGRAKEEEQLRHLLQKAAAGTGGVVLLQGEAGSGKTALLKRAFDFAGSGFLEIPVHCPVVPKSSGVWRVVVSEVAYYGRQTPPEDPAGVSAELVVAWLRSLSGPVLLTLDHLQRIDPDSLSRLIELASLLRSVRVLIIGTCRQDELSAEHTLRELSDLYPRVQIITLERLQEQDVAQLMAAVLGHGTEISAATKQIYRESGGNPQCMVGCLQRHLLGAPEFLVPLRRFVEAKLRALKPNTEEILQAAAVIGQPFLRGRMTEVAMLAYNLSKADVEAALDEAVERDLIRRDDAVGGPMSYWFNPEVLCDVISGQMKQLRQDRLQQALADVLLREGDRALRQQNFAQACDCYERMHALDLSDQRRAEVLLKLGYIAQEVDRESALRMWHEALTFAREAGDNAVIMWCRHLLVFDTFRRQAGQATPDQLERLMQEQDGLRNDPRYEQLTADLYGGWPPNWPPISPVYALALALSGQRNKGEESIRSLLAKADLGAPLSRDLLEAGAQVAFMDGRFSAAAEWMGRCREFAKFLPEPRRLQWTAETEGLRLWFLWLGQADQPHVIDDVARNCAALEAKLQRKSPEMLSVLGGFHFLRGQWCQAYQELVVYLDRHRDDSSWDVRWFAAQLQLAFGDVKGAKATIAEIPVLDPDTPPSLGPAQVWPHCIRAQVHLAEGQHDRAKDWLDAADHWLQERNLVAHAAYVHNAWAEYWLALGNPSDAYQRAKRALDDAERVHDCLQIIAAHRLLGIACTAQRKATEAREHFDQAFTLANMCNFPYEATLADRLRGQAVSYSAAKQDAARIIWPESPLLSAPSEPAVRFDWRKWNLSRQEAEVAQYLCRRELTPKEIAGELRCDLKTVNNHAANVYRKTLGKAEGKKSQPRERRDQFCNWYEDEIRKTRVLTYREDVRNQGNTAD